MNYLMSGSIILTVTCLVLSSFSFAGPPDPGFDMNDEEAMFWEHLAARGKDARIIYTAAQLDSVIYAEMDMHNIPGLAFSIIKDSQIVYNQIYGYANFENSVPVDYQTLFITASISKTFVANAAMIRAISVISLVLLQGGLAARPSGKQAAPPGHHCHDCQGYHDHHVYSNVQVAVHIDDDKRRQYPLSFRSQLSGN